MTEEEGAVGAGVCPWLGVEADRQLRYAGPSELHLCHAQRRPAPIGVEHQAAVCLTAAHETCPFYREPNREERANLTADADDDVGPPPRRLSALRLALWLVAAMVAVAVLVVYSSELTGPTRLVAATAPLLPSPSPTDTRIATGTPPAAGRTVLRPTGTPTPSPGGAIYVLEPEPGAAGWVASDQERGNYLGDSYLYAGVFDGVIYHAIFRFDLSSIPRGAALHAGVLDLRGLDMRRLGGHGVWEVRVLERGADEGWSQISYQAVHNAAVQWSLAPAMAPGDLAPDQVNTFVLSGEQLRDLEQRLVEERYGLELRIDGPLAGENSVAAWDGGYGSATRGYAPRLWLSAGAPPLTPLPSGTPPIVVVTSTPTPANVVTVMAVGQTATAQAAEGRLPTPTSAYEWTATPEWVVTGTPAAANTATAEWQALVATAIAFTTGTPTPTPPWLWTATPTPVSIPAGELPPTPTPLPPTPTPPLPEALRGQILFRSNRLEGAGIWAMDGEGQEVALLTADWPYAAVAGGQALSPDGGEVVYGGRSGGRSTLWVRDLATGKSRRLFSSDTAVLSAPAWSPGGDRIAFVSTGGGTSDLWLVDSTGRRPRLLKAVAGGSAVHPSFSPDGQRVAYAAVDADGRRQVWSIRVDGSGAQNLSQNGYDEWDPVWVK